MENEILVHKFIISKNYPFLAAEMKIVEIQAVSGKSLFPVDMSPPPMSPIVMIHDVSRPPTRGPGAEARRTRLWSPRHLAIRKFYINK